ncbi:hypothetical protein [Trinickia soli]|uniref:hypothetical protein n=1 Tax=Trinickia soli TaxID=380675 RepID=UPI0012BA239A
MRFIFSRLMKERLSRIACLLLICVIPGVCEADVGNLGGVIDMVVVIIKYLTDWALISLAFYFILWCCKVSSNKRMVFTILFGISPIFLSDPAIKLYGEPGTHVIVQTEKPVVLAGTTFPAGSRADYIHLGGGFWRRKLVEVTSTRPVRFGPWDITDLRLDPPVENIAYVNLVRPEVIDGWACDETPSFELTSGLPRLHGCKIVAPRKIGDLNWFAGTFVQREQNNDWSLDLFAYDIPNGSKDPAQAFGFPIDRMSATYSASYELRTWTGSAISADLPIGDYIFSRVGDTKLTWQAPGRIVVAGYGKERKTGAAVACVLVQLADGQTRPCEKRSESDQERTP